MANHWIFSFNLFPILSHCGPSQFWQRAKHRESPFVCVYALLMESLPAVTDSLCHLSLSHCLCAALFVWECCQQLFLTSLNRITSNRKLDVLVFNIVVELKVFRSKYMKFSFFRDSITLFYCLYSSLEISETIFLLIKVKTSLLGEH